MYLTRFEINPARAGARQLLASPHRMHGAVMKAFPSAARTGSEEGRILWRVDSSQQQTMLYLVSPHEPDLTHLVEQAGWPATQSWHTRDYQPLLERLTSGDRWAFRITANPVRNGRKSSDAVETQRLGHVTVPQQTTWLLQRAERNGFTIPTTVTHQEPDVAVTRRKTWRFTRHGNTVTLATAMFEGRLDVTDPDKLRAALVRGIGSGKGYGCGLLTLARME